MIHAWVLALVLQIGSQEIIIQPVAYYTDSTFAQIMRMSDRDSMSKELNVILTCYQEAEI